MYQRGKSIISRLSLPLAYTSKLCQGTPVLHLALIISISLSLFSVRVRLWNRQGFGRVGGGRESGVEVREKKKKKTEENRDVGERESQVFVSVGR